MGRKKMNYAYNYFELDGENGTEKTSKCLVCSKILKTQHGTNLLKHLRSTHKSIYELVIKKNTDGPSLKNKENVESTTRTILRECVHLTTIHGRPFTLIDDQAFQNILALIPSQFQLTVNASKVKEHVMETASAMRKDLSNELKNKLVSLKVDAATLQTRCFLGINIQYALNDKIIVKNIGVIELYARHTGEYLADNVLMTLNRLHISIDQIYCSTTDNGSNMIKMSKIFQENVRSALYISEYSDAESDSEGDNENDIDPESFQENLNNALASSFSQNDCSIPAVRCAAHTLQLAVRDACSDDDTQNLIKLVRNLVKKLRRQNYSMFLKASGNKKPMLDCSTRWGSTFDMAKRFLELKEVTSDEPNNDLFFPPDKWLILEEFVKSLEPSKILTKILQTEQLSMSDLYGNWLKCEIETTGVNLGLSGKVVEQMKIRQKQLFTNEAFISAIYLDPRFNVILSADEQKAARDHLIKTYRRMIFLESRNLVREDTGSTAAEDNEIHDITDDSQSAAVSTSAATNVTSTEDKIRDFMTEKYSEHRNSNASATTPTNEIDKLTDLLVEFLNEPLLHHSENIFRYWQTKKTSMPLLYQLSQIALSAPATQVSVERLFSSLKFVVTNLRMTLKDDLVDDILFIRNNANTQ